MRKVYFTYMYRINILNTHIPETPHHPQYNTSARSFAAAPSKEKTKNLKNLTVHLHICVNSERLCFPAKNNFFQKKMHEEHARRQRRTMSTTLPLPPPPRARFTSIGPGEHVLGFGLAFPAIDASRVTLLSTTTSEDETKAVGSTTTTTTTERAAGFDAKKESTASLGRALGELLMECDVSYLYVGVKRTRTRRTNERTNALSVFFF